jgi:hypothetical protein
MAIISEAANLSMKIFYDISFPTNLVKLLTFYINILNTRNFNITEQYQKFLFGSLVISFKPLA